MDTRESVLRALIEGGGEYISGEALAERLNISRAAVWKAIRTLKAEGREIEAVTNRGYRLVGGGDVFSAAAVRELARSDGLSISFEREVTGTNAVLKERAAAGAPEGTVLIASHQTAGRGRYGRAFYSPEGTGVYLSIILRPRFEARKAQLITCLAAVAGAKAVEKVSGRKTEIKWVNDILLEG
ncbi:MAG: biotin--[Oscillospiraceae bacterium]|nr:biotin--[acetyl-CoA-carboxylase] ligase [Oscillospiraceae bacterium]